MLSILILLLLAIYQAHSATIKFDVSLASPNIALDCTYTLESNEILYRVILKKDSETFVSFDDSTKDKPQFTQVEGITDVTLNGAGKVTINNYQDSTWGIYSCNVYYDLKTNKKSNSNSKKKVKESKGTEKCKATWTAYSGVSLPSGVWVTGANNMGTSLVFCRANDGDNVIPGYLRDIPGAGKVECVYTMDFAVKVVQSDFEILCGTGFEWTPYDGHNAPKNSHQAGKDSQGTTFIARCSVNGDTYLGKLNDKFYTAYNNEEWADCKQSEIVLCAQ